MLVPPQVALHEALVPLKEDLVTLRQGVKMQAYVNGERKEVMVKAAISFVVSDHPQGCELARHLGVAANKNCRFCWTSKEQRSEYHPDMLNHRNTRRKEQTNVIVRQMLRLKSEQKLNKTKMKALQTLTGIRPLPCPLESVEVDLHLQAIPDFDHFMDLGLVMRLFAYISSTLSEKEKEEAEVRMKSLSLPRGWNKFNLNLNSVAKKMKPMTYMRKMCVLGIFLFQGFLEPPIHSLLVHLLQLRGLMLSPFQNNSTIKTVTFYFIFYRQYFIFFIRI